MSSPSPSDDVAMATPASDDGDLSSSSTSARENAEMVDTVAPAATAPSLTEAVGMASPHSTPSKAKSAGDLQPTEAANSGESMESDGCAAESTSASSEPTLTPTVTQTATSAQSPQPAAPPLPEFVNITIYTTSKIPRTHKQNQPIQVRVRAADITLEVVREQFPDTAKLKTEKEYKTWIHTDGRKMENKRETGVIATLRNWHLHPDDDDEDNVETSLRMISKNPTIVRKSIIVYCAWRDYVEITLNGADPARQVSLAYFDEVDMAVIQSPHRLRLLFTAFLDMPDNQVEEYASTRLKMRALAEKVLDDNPYIGSIVNLLDNHGTLVLEVTLADAPDARSSTRVKKNKAAVVNEAQQLSTKQLPFDKLWPLEQNQVVIRAAFAKLSAQVDLISPRPDQRYQVTWKDNRGLRFLTRRQLQQVEWTGHVYPPDNSLSDCSSSSSAEPVSSLSLASLSLHGSPAPFSSSSIYGSSLSSSSSSSSSSTFPFGQLDALDPQALAEVLRHVKELTKKRKRDSGTVDEQVGAKRMLQLDSPAVGARTRSKKKDKRLDMDSRDSDRENDRRKSKRWETEEESTRDDPLLADDSNDGEDKEVEPTNDSDNDSDNGKNEKYPSDREDTHRVDEQRTVGYIWRGFVKEQAVRQLEVTPHHVDTKFRLKGFPLPSRLGSAGTVVASIWIVPAGAQKFSVHVRSTKLVRVYGPWQKARAMAFVMLSAGKPREDISAHLKEYNFDASEEDFSVCSRELSKDKRLRGHRHPPSPMSSTESQKSDEDEDDTADEA